MAVDLAQVKRPETAVGTGRVKVLHIITRLIPGGAQENALLTVALADRRRYEVHLAAGPEGAWGERGRQTAEAFHLIPSLRQRIRPGADLPALTQLIRLMRRERFTIVHTHTSKAGMLGRLAARLVGVPVVVHTPHGSVLHEAFLRPHQQRIAATLKRWAAGLSDAVITMSQRERDTYVRWGIGSPGKFRTIYSGLDYRRFSDLPRERERTRAALGLSDGRPLVFFPARYVPEKGHQVFFAAIERVLVEMPEAVAALAGDGPLAQEVEGLRAQSAFPDRIHLLGFRRDVLALMQAADVVVSASLTEGLPRAVVEALLLARPVVASDAGGTREVVRHGETGVLVECGDAQGMTDGMLWMLRHPAEAARMGEAGREHVSPLFDAREMVRRIEDLYQQCLAGKGLVPYR